MRIIDLIRKPDGWYYKQGSVAGEMFCMNQPIMHPETQAELIGRGEDVTSAAIDRLVKYGVDELEMFNLRTSEVVTAVIHV